MFMGVDLGIELITLYRRFSNFCFKGCNKSCWDHGRCSCRILVLMVTLLCCGTNVLHNRLQTFLLLTDLFSDPEIELISWVKESYCWFAEWILSSISSSTRMMLPYLNEIWFQREFFMFCFLTAVFHVF